MLLVFMYHLIGVGKHANSEKMLYQHLSYIKKNYPIVLPGDSVRGRKLSICLTFDDAFFNFFHFVFPMLEELKIRVLLAVPTRYILDTTSIDADTRLSVHYGLAMQDGFFENKAPFCTWEELDKMVRTGYVEIASHSYSHSNLTFDFVDLHKEVVESKMCIGRKLSKEVSSFVYPFGRTNQKLHEYVAKHYNYDFRIGTALNSSWGHVRKPIYRITGDNMSSAASLLSCGKMFKYAANAAKKFLFD